MRYSGAAQNSVVTGGSPAIELIPPPGKSIQLISVTAMLTGATFSPFSLARSGGAGTPTTTVKGAGYDGRSISQSLLASTWSAMPVNALNLAWLFIPGTVGASGVWRPSAPVIITTSFLVWNANATATASGFTIEWDED